MKKIHCSIFFLLISSCLFSQDQHRIDSLNHELQTAIQDTTKANTLIALANEYYLENPGAAINYLKQAKEISERSHFQSGISDAYGWLAYLYEQQGEIDTALAYYYRSLKLFQERGKKKDEATVLNNIAAIYKDQGKINEALSLHDQSLKLREEIGDSSGVATSLNNIGLIYFNQGRIPEALDYYFRSLKLDEKLKDNDGIITALVNIAGVYEDQGQLIEAMNYYKKTLQLSQQIKDQYNIGSSLNHIGKLLERENKLDSALIFYSLALSIRQQISDVQGMSYTMKNLGNVYDKKGLPDTALSYFERSLRGFQKADDTWGKAISLNKLAGIFLEQHNLKAAEENASASLKIAQELGYPEDIRNAAETLDKIYRIQNQWQKAIAMNDLFISMRDSVTNIQNKKASLQQQFKYEYDKKEAVLNAEHEKKEAIAASQLQKQKLLRDVFIGGSFLLVILIILLWNRYRLKQRSEREIKSTYDKLKMSQEQLVRQEKLASLGQLTAGIAHEIKNPLNFISNFSELSEELISEFDTAKSDAERREILSALKSNLTKISRHGKRADGIVHSMLAHSRTAKDDKQLTDINWLCEEYAVLAYQSFRASHRDFNCVIEKYFAPDLPKVNVVQADVSRVLLNLFNNAFYALREKVMKDQNHQPILYLKTMFDEKNNAVGILVRDNGIGIPSATREKIFEPFFTTKPAGQGTGLGLSISYDIVKAHGGEMKVNSSEGESAEFIISLPIIKS